MKKELNKLLAEIGKLMKEAKTKAGDPEAAKAATAATEEMKQASVKLKEKIPAMEEEAAKLKVDHVCFCFVLFLSFVRFAFGKQQTVATTEVKAARPL